MTSSIYKATVYLFLCSLVFQPLSASSTNQLIIKPSVCMVKKLGDSCQMKVKVIWHNTYPVDACLFQNDLRLICWENTQDINADIHISLDQDMKFILKQNEKILAYQQIKINTILPKKYRRRLRADWSFF
ncbi:DUF3019 domain-containing protein [Colwellia sp. Arc7-635]|uniref:DUF3019 domain-containing protein n=1 Tax=Colwellia sp. Arc7-635 TaxID=2497879 RepID=UPI0013E0B272|nr:DUF3019 domain-containing protein [Colwellia sp. Arc7-635]